jgi:hypothetical protein
LTCAQLARRSLIRQPSAHSAGFGGEQVQETTMQNEQVQETTIEQNVIDKIYIDGEFVTPHGTELFDLFNPPLGK